MKTEQSKGFWGAIATYTLWGTVPIYWKFLQHIPATELISHRLIWSSLLCLCLIAITKKWTLLFKTLKTQFWILLVTTICVSSNWLLFVWAVNQGRIIETSLGYYINPIFNILLGAFFLKERLTKLQALSAVLAILGVLYSVVTADFFPWVSLLIAITFGLYSLIRKISPIEPLIGLTLEASLLTPIAFIYCGYLSSAGLNHFGQSTPESLLMAGAGFVTLVPLLLFLYSVKRIPLSTMGFLQFITPTTTFIIATHYYHEPLSLNKIITFIFIWAAVLLYLSDLNLQRRKKKSDKINQTVKL